MRVCLLKIVGDDSDCIVTLCVYMFEDGLNLPC